MVLIRRMCSDDVTFGLHLCRQAGWNQTEADWRRFLELQPDGCFLAEAGGVPVGTTVAFVFGTGAWVAMVLVEAAQRGRGIGGALMRHALDHLDRRGVVTVRLDATPQGQPLYERLGFVEQFRLSRHEGILPAAECTGGENVQPIPREALAALDAEVTGTDRRWLLDRLCTEQSEEVRGVCRDGRWLGFMMARPGHQALQLGPCVATPAAGPLLLADAWRRHAGRRVYLDVPLPNEAALRVAEAMGLRVQRQLTRMCRGTSLGERVEWLWASSGPEKG